MKLSLIGSEGYGVFESLRAYRGVLFGLEEHLDRFFESAKTVGLAVPVTREQIKKRLQKALAESGKKDAFVRLTLVGGGGAQGAALRERKGRERPFLSILVTERRHPASLYEKGVSLRTSPVKRSSSRSAFPEAKSTAFLNQILASLDPAAPETYERLFLGPEGYLTEARIGNLFIVKNGDSPPIPKLGTGPFRDLSLRGPVPATVLITPPPYGLLNGVTRRFVIKCARSAGIPVEETPLTRHELFNAEEAFLTNTSWEILPVREVDGRNIGTAVPGPVTKKLQAIFRSEVQREIRRSPNGKK